MADPVELSSEARAVAIAEAFKSAPPEGITDPDMLPPRPPSRRESRVTRFENAVTSVPGRPLETSVTHPVPPTPPPPPFKVDVAGDRLGPVAFFNAYFQNLSPTYLTSVSRPEGIVSVAIKCYRGYVAACREADRIGEDVGEWRE